MSISLWKPMTTAPKDKPIMLKNSNGLSIAKWHKQPQYNYTGKGNRELKPTWVWAALVSGEVVPDEGWDTGCGCVLEVIDPIGWQDLPEE